MTPEQIADRNSVWARMEIEHPEFTHAHDPSDNYHAVREIVLSGSVTWRAANEYFKPWRGKRVMDVGANVGVYSAYCGIHEAAVTAYEPFPEAFALLKKMVRYSRLEDYVTPINKAVWTYTGEIPHLGHKTENEDVTCYNGGLKTDGVNWTEEDYRRAPTVKCISFEEALGKEDWDMVKLDIEGAELEIIMATPVEALKRIKFSYVELHPWAGDELHNEVMRKLESIFKIVGYPQNPSDGRQKRFEALYLWRKP